MKERRLDIYDIEMADKLRRSQKPFAYKTADILCDTKISKVEAHRAMVDCILSLESIKEELFKELISYKARYGESLDG